MNAVTDVRYFITRHALDRMAEMNVGRLDVDAVIRTAEFTCPDPVPGRRRYFGADLVVVIQIVNLATGLPHIDPVIVTVLYRCEVPYEPPANLSTRVDRTALLR